MKLKSLNYYYKMLFFADKWNIGYTKQTAEQLISQKKFTDKINWLKEDPADYCADPFYLGVNGTKYIYYEHLDHWTGLGEIYQIKNFDFKTKKKVTGLDLKLHLSYPYIFKDGGEIYCIPETARANEISLFHIDAGNLSDFKKKRVLVSGAQYVDSSLIQYKGKYWLFTNKRNCSDLFIFHANSLNDEFVPHPMNPIKHEENKYRSAGSLFVVNDELYRPTQNCEIRYGGSLIVRKVTDLSESSFSSEFAFELLPEQPYNRGLHNISFGNDLIVIDGKKSSFSIFMPIKVALRRYRLWRIKRAHHLVYASAFVASFYDQTI